MVGTKIVSRNQLRSIAPELCEAAEKNYIGREALLNERVPFLECEIGDVIFLAGVHPEDIYLAQKKCGLLGVQKLSAYEIPLDRIDPNKAVIMWASVATGPFYSRYDPKEIARYAVIPEDTLQYYRDIADLGHRPYKYNYIPQILFRGEIETAGLRIARCL